MIAGRTYLVFPAPTRIHKLECEVAYQVQRTPLGLAMMYVAGLISGLLGIGSGTFKVLAMDTVMRLLLKVSTTTSIYGS